MNILIGNRQKLARPALPRIRRLVRFFMEQVQRRNPRRRWGDVSLVLADDAGMARLNCLYLDREGATDVISFALPAVPGPAGRGPERGAGGGELFVNVERARERGRGRADRELALYIAHACDHVGGAADRSAAGRRRMRARELAWLRVAEKKGLLNSLLRPKVAPCPPRQPRMRG